MSAHSMWTSKSTAETTHSAANAAQFWDDDYDGDCAETNASKSSWRVYHSPDWNDMLSAVEDVWLRLISSANVKFATCWDHQTQRHMVMFRAIRDECESQTLNLLEVAASSALYTWQAGSQIFKFCSSLQWIGDTLVIELQPVKLLPRGEGGEELMSRLKALTSNV